MKNKLYKHRSSSKWTIPPLYHYPSPILPEIETWKRLFLLLKWRMAATTKNTGLYREHSEAANNLRDKTAASLCLNSIWENLKREQSCSTLGKTPVTRGLTTAILTNLRAPGKLHSKNLKGWSTFYGFHWYKCSCQGKSSREHTHRPMTSISIFILGPRGTLKYTLWITSLQ